MEDIFCTRCKSQATQLKGVSLDKGDTVSLMFNISFWQQQVKESSQQIGREGLLKADCLGSISGYGVAMWNTLLQHQHSNCKLL